MAGNTVYMQPGSKYIDIHDNEVVNVALSERGANLFATPSQSNVTENNLNIDKGTVTVSDGRGMMEEVNNDNDNDNEDAEPVEEELNYFAPTNSLQLLLKQPWFNETRSDKKYTAKWTDAFVEALMASKYSEQIAREWYNDGRLDKCTQIKGYLLGLLKDVKVLKGSYDTIAGKVNLMDNARSFSRYMSKGKKQSYAQWVKRYVMENS